MKIAVVAPTPIPARTANSLQVMKMSQALAALGHEVRVASPTYQLRRHAGQHWQELARHYGLQKAFPIDWLPANPRFRRYDYAAASGELGTQVAGRHPLHPPAASCSAGQPAGREDHPGNPRPPAGQAGTLAIPLVFEGGGSQATGGDHQARWQPAWSERWGIHEPTVYHSSPRMASISPGMQICRQQQRRAPGWRLLQGGRLALPRVIPVTCTPGEAAS